MKRENYYIFFISDEKYKILNAHSSIGFNGWKNVYIRLSFKFKLAIAEVLSQVQQSGKSLEDAPLKE